MNENQEFKEEVKKFIKVTGPLEALKSNEEFHPFKIARTFILFAATYLILYFGVILSVPLHGFLIDVLTAANTFLPIFWPIKSLVETILPLGKWDSPMYFLLPIPGFFLMYYLTDWLDEFFELNDDFHNKLFVLVFWILVLAGYAISLLWYYYNFYVLTLNNYAQLKEIGLSFTQYLFGGQLSNGQTYGGTGFNYWGELKNSAYLVFCIAAFLAWISRKFVKNIIDAKIKRFIKTENAE